MRWMLLFLCVTTGCSLANHSATTTRVVEAVAGCYAVEYGEWGAEIAEGHLPIPAELPAQLQLHASPDPFWSRRGQVGRPWYQARSLPELPSSPDLLHVWRPVDSDSIFVGSPVQTGGFNLHLVRDGADLRGEAEVYTDMISLTEANQVRTSVIARRIPCLLS